MCNYHEHKGEAEARKNQTIIVLGFSHQLDVHKIKVVSQYFLAKKIFSTFYLS